MLVERYRPILYLQYLLLFVDLFMNSFIEVLRYENVILLVLLVIQDLCIMFAVIVIFLVFFNTYIFQAGLVNILVNKFKVTIAVVFIYFSLCVGFHVWYMEKINVVHGIGIQTTMASIGELANMIYYVLVTEALLETTLRWLDPNRYIWDTPGIRALYVIQRTASVLYYYFYKRTCLKLGDPRFYQDSDWIKHEFEKRR